MAYEQVACEVCGAAVMTKFPEQGPFRCDRHSWIAPPVPETMFPMTADAPPKLVPVGPPQRQYRKKMVRAGGLTPAGRVMLSRQGGVCALCGVPGWGKHKDKVLKTGSLLRARCGPQVMGIYCRPCAALVQRLRVKVTKYCEAKRGPSGDGSRNQGGSR